MTRNDELAPEKMTSKDISAFGRMTGIDGVRDEK